LIEQRALTVLVPRIAILTLLALTIGTLATNNNTTGSINKPIYLCVLVLALATTVFFLRNQRSPKLEVALALLASCGLLWGISTIERPQLLSSYWEGFGYRVGIGAIVLALLFGTVVRPSAFSRPIRALLALILAACCACDLLALIRTFDFMPYVNNNLNEINDTLGPVAGGIPDSTFISQYTTFYGWLFLPFKNVLSPAALVALIAVFFTALDVATVLIATWIVRRLLPVGGLLLAVAIAVPITYVTSHLAGDQSSIASLFQELPIRVLSGFVVLALGLNDLVLLYRGSVRPKQLGLLGVLCAIVAWNSQDFGLAAAGAYGIVVLFGTESSVRARALGVWLTGLLIGAAAYPLFLVAIGSPPNLGFVAAFVKLYGSGLQSAPMQVPGPVLIVMPIIVCSTAVGWTLMRARHRSDARRDALLDQATITLAFVGTWSVASLTYYVNRAYATGQLQTMLLPCAVCIAALLSIAIRTGTLSSLRQRTGGAPFWTGLTDKFRLLPVGIFVCLCFASALLTPDPIAAARNLLHPPAMTGYGTYDLPQVLSAVRAAQAYTSDKPGELTYLGENFNYVSLDAHVRSSAILFPFSLTPDRVGVIQLECKYLAGHHSEWMVLSLDAVFAFGTNTCGMYHGVTLRGLANGQLQELK
jgi:hypothetical protein